MPAALHILASRVVKQAIADGAVIDPIDQFPRIAELDRLAREITCPPIAEELDLLDAPIIVDDVRLQRLSWAAREWLSTSAYEWWEGDAVLLDLAYAFAMAHARNKTVLQSVRTDPKRARKIIGKWARSTEANYDAIMAACRYLSPKRAESASDKPAEKNGSYIGQTLLTLITETDKPLDYWIYEAPAELVEGTLARIRENLYADTARMARALKQDVAPDPNSWHSKASDRFSKACRAFRKDLGLPERVSLAKAAEAPIRDAEPVVEPGKVDDDSSGVKSGEQVNDHTPEQAPAGNDQSGPRRDREDDEEAGAHVADIEELGPAGDDE